MPYVGVHRCFLPCSVWVKMDDEKAVGRSELLSWIAVVIIPWYAKG